MKSRILSANRFLFLSLYVLVLGAAHFQSQTSEFWQSRDVTVTTDISAPKIRIGVWDSGVEPAVFGDRIVKTRSGNLLLRGYDPYKLRKDTPMEVLPPELLARRDELNALLKAFDDLNDGVDSPQAKALGERLKKLSKKDQDEFYDAIGRWSGYAHGTAVADIAIAGNPQSEILIARMEWWHGSPPVPCWTKELADREAKSIDDLLRFLVRNGARVINMSWGRFERSYVSALKECAPSMSEADRNSLARYTVEEIRKVLRNGMAAAPHVLFVGAAGNSGTTVGQANPATRFSLPNFLIVGAVDRNGAKAKFTNTGEEVTLYANGERVPARLPGGEISYPSGTSMAAPNVSNAAAKVLTVNPKLSGAEVRAILEQTAEPNATGQKLLHPARAMAAAEDTIKSGSRSRR